MMMMKLARRVTPPKHQLTHDSFKAPLQPLKFKLKGKLRASEHRSLTSLSINVHSLSVDDEFWTLLDAYVNEGIWKDVKSMQVGCGISTLPDEFQRLMNLASCDLVCKLEEFMKRMAAAHKFFSQCGGKKSCQALDQSLVS